MDAAPDPEVVAALNRVSQVYTLVAFWLEGAAYGLYFGLFIFCIRIMTRKKGLDHFASRLFFIGVISMFILITFHMATVVYKMICAYALYIGTPPGLPVLYFQDFVRWDNYAHPVILALITWLGDYLVIYRCFLIWRRNYTVIIVPSLLLLASIVITSVNLYWFKNPTEIPWETIRHFLNAIFPINLSQNILTTGLIAYKIWRQYMQTRASGLMLSSNNDLLTIVRIIVESAAIYTIETTVMIILFYKEHPGLVIVQHLLAPSIGIVFVLIAVRTHVTKVESDIRGYRTSSMMHPSWMSSNRPDDIRRGHGMPIVTVTEHHHLDTMTPTKEDHELSQRSSSEVPGKELRYGTAMAV